MVLLTRLLSLATLFLPLTVYGITNDFTVRTFIGSDTAPPTIPSSLTAIPVATTQINLSWGTSTDDYLLSGYRVYRDDTHVATTTNTFYSDTGLTPSTTYSYYVTAFDYFGNTSASSTVVATTTLATPPPAPTTTPTTTPGGGTKTGSIVHPPVLLSVSSIPGVTDVRILYETDKYIRPTVRWGRTSSYELGSSAGTLYAKLHETSITNLAPNTLYTFSIEGEDERGRRVVLTTGTFRTLPLSDTLPPGVVTSFTGNVEGEDVVLSWDNPDDSDFSYVRLMGSDTFYPTDSNDGWVVYEGSGESARESGVLDPGALRYYTIFAYDERGNVSAGAVTRVTRSPDVGGGVATSVPPLIDDHIPSVFDIGFADIAFYQDGEKLESDSGRVTIDGGTYLTIVLPYDALPEHLKTILVTLTDVGEPTKEFAFLLRVNEAKTAYTARIAPFGISSSYTLRLAIFDYTKEQVGTTRGTIISTLGDSGGARTDDLTIWKRFGYYYETTYAILFVILLLIIAFLLRSLMYNGQREDNNRTHTT